MVCILKFKARDKTLRYENFKSAIGGLFLLKKIPKKILKQKITTQENIVFVKCFSQMD